MFAFRSQNTHIWGVVWLNLINIEYMIRFYMKGMLCLDLGRSVNFFSQGTSYEMSGIDGSPFLIFCVKRQASPHLEVLRVWTKRIHISFSGVKLHSNMGLKMELFFLVGGLELVLFHILGIIFPFD